MSSAEDGHQHTEAAKKQGVKRAAERPPCAQAQEGEEINRRGERRQHHAWRMSQNTTEENTMLIELILKLFNHQY